MECSRYRLVYTSRGDASERSMSSKSELMMPPQNMKRSKSAACSSPRTLLSSRR